MALQHAHHRYIEGPEATVLHTLDLWLPESNRDGTRPDGKWVIFIHGGAWRDPLIDALSFQPTVNLLSTADSARDIAGYASLNYRLSPYPSHPTQPSSPHDPARNAKHPDHLHDVTRALLFLEHAYGISDRYVLVGHSCGATLAFQIPETHGGAKVPQPAAIAGSEGIYDMPALVAANEHPAYRQFVASAFGDDESVWRQASPRTSEAAAVWAKTKVLRISHSEDDELVGGGQSLMMLKRLSETEDKRGAQAVYLPAAGRHDEIWERGVEIASIVKDCLQSMQ